MPVRLMCLSRQDHPKNTLSLSTNGIANCTRRPAGWAWSVEASSIASFTATRVSRHDQPYVYPSSPTTTSAEAPATYYRTNRPGVICTLLFHCLSSFILNRPLLLDLVVSCLLHAVPYPPYLELCHYLISVLALSFISTTSAHAQHLNFSNGLVWAVFDACLQ